MATITWGGGRVGNWTSRLNWQGFAQPAPTDDAVADAATITIDSAVAAHDVSLVDGARLELLGALTLGGTLSGTVDLAGRLVGGTLEGALFGQGGTLEGVRLGAGVALADVTLDAATVAASDSVTLAGAVTLAAGRYDTGAFVGGGTLSAAPAGVTLGALAAIDSAGGSAGLTLMGGPIDNLGQIIAEPQAVNAVATYLVQGAVPNDAQTVTIPYVARTPTNLLLAAPAFANAGLIAVRGGTLELAGASFHNSGTVLLSDGSTQVPPALPTDPVASAPLLDAMVVDASVQDFANTGTIIADTVSFAGSIALAALGHISGALTVSGTLDLGGGTLDAGQYTSVTVTGTVEHGTLRAGSGTLDTSGATLIDVLRQGSHGAPVTLEGVPFGSSFVNLNASTVELEFSAGVNLAGLQIFVAGAPSAAILALDAGTVTLDSASNVQINGATLDVIGPGALRNDGGIGVQGALDIGTDIGGAGQITVAAGSSLSVTGTLAGALQVSLATGGAASLATVDGAPTLHVAAGAALDIATLRGAPTLALDIGATLSIGTLLGAPSVTLAAGGSLTLGGEIAGASSLTLGDHAAMHVATLDGAAAATLGMGSTLDAGTLGGFARVEVGPNARLHLAQVTGSPTIVLGSGASVTIDALGGAPEIVFAGSPALAVLPQSGALGVTLSRLSSGDLIDFTGVSSVPSGPFAIGGATTADGALLVTGASGETASVPLVAPDGGLIFSAEPDPFGGTLIDVACFAAGSGIATARGRVPVERLRVGDLVRTAGGPLRPVVWLGWREVDAASHPKPEDVWPVRVRAGAIAPGQPSRDLLLSPDHALLLDGALVPVRYLLNGATIVQERVARIAYWHVELPEHGALLAEGLAAESFLDTGNRGAFANAPGSRRPDRAAALRVWRERACAPLLIAGPRLAALHARYRARAMTLGWRCTRLPGLAVLAGPRRIAPRRDGGLRRFLLPPDAGSLRLVSRSFSPLDVAGPGHDPRRLGVAVAGLLLDGAPLALDDARLSAGWHASEGPWRWTQGEAVIEAGAARELAVALAMTGEYWARDAARAA